MLVLSIGFAYWPQFARVTRATTLAEKNKDYVNAARIIGVDTNPAREASSRLAGVTDFINPQAVDDVVGHIREITGGGADYSFECVGRAELWRQAVECTRIGWGTAVMVGVPPSAETVAFRPRSLLEGRRIMGSYLGNIKTRSELPQLVEWYAEGKLSLDRLVSHRISLEEINTGFDLLRQGSALRSVSSRLAKHSRAMCWSRWSAVHRWLLAGGARRCGS